jgi:hypothetical protein
MNQQIDNNTYRNFGMAFVSSRSGLKQSSINPRPLGLTTIQCAPNEKIQDQIFYPPVPEIGGAMQVMQTIKSMADSASGLSPNINSGKGGKISVSGKDMVLEGETLHASFTNIILNGDTQVVKTLTTTSIKNSGDIATATIGDVPVANYQHS